MRVVPTAVNCNFPLEFTGSPTQLFCLLGAGEYIQVVFLAFEKVEEYTFVNLAALWGGM